jgi:hypothetical protein
MNPLQVPQKGPYREGGLPAGHFVYAVAPCIIVDYDSHHGSATNFQTSNVVRCFWHALNILLVLRILNLKKEIILHLF